MISQADSSIFPARANHFFLRIDSSQIPIKDFPCSVVTHFNQIEGAPKFLKLAVIPENFPKEREARCMHKNFWQTRTHINLSLPISRDSNYYNTCTDQRCTYTCKSL
jgi:hypothetical protein